MQSIESNSILDWQVIEEKTSYFSNDRFIYASMHIHMSPTINEQSKKQLGEDRDLLMELYECGLNKTTSLEDGIEWIDCAMNLADLCDLLGVKFIIKRGASYQIEIGGYPDNTGWLLIFSATKEEEVSIVYLDQAQPVFEREIKIDFPPQVIQISLDYDLELEEE